MEYICFPGRDRMFYKVPDRAFHIIKEPQNHSTTFSSNKEIAGRSILRPKYCEMFGRVVGWFFGKISFLS